MKKSLKLFSLLLGSTFVLAGCNDFSSGWPENLPSADEMGIDTPWTDYTVPCTSIAFAKGEANLDLLKGETHTYSYSVEPKDFNTSLLVWESDNPAVATIQNGVLTAVGGGKANISLSYGDVMARSLVNVNVPITDFNVLNKEVSLDIEGTSQITCELSPADTTQNAIHYETESSIISVSDSGLISALGSAGDAEIKVTNEALNKVEVINVHVSDMWNYVSSLTLSGPEKLEVNKVDTLSSSVVAIDPSKEASTLAHNKVVYSVKEGSEAYVSVDAETGNITGLEPGTATLVATLHEERSNTDKVDEFDVEVFEVSATAISLNETGTIELDNNENLSHLLGYTYTLSDTSFDAPSRGNVTFTSSDVNVAKVNDDGLVEVVGPGSATITVKDTTYNVSDTVDVHTTIYAKSVVLAGGADFYLDEDVEITANVTPANTTDPLVWDYDTTTGHNFVEDGNKLIVTCNNLDNPVEVKASVGGVTSNVITLTPKEREVAFESGKTYIVGSSNFKSGVSKDVDGGSWNAAKYAFVMTDKTGNAHAKYEYKATIEFRENDEWKIRENVEDWRAISSSNGLYKVTEGAFAKGQMSVSGTPEEGNVLVKEAGKYDVYYAYYDDTETGWYEVYVEEHGMKLSSTDIHAKLTSPVTVSTISVDNYDGTVVLDEVDEEYISASFDSLTSKISITPVKVGKTSFKVCDDYKEILVNVEIKEGSDAKATAYYIRGDAANGWGIDESYVLRESAEDNNYGEILDVYLKAGSFKIADENWSEGTVWGYEYGGHTTVIGGAAANFTVGDSDNNIKCNVAGYYDIYLTKDNYISIESAGVEPVPFMWGIAGSGTDWQLDTAHPFVESTKEGDALYTYKLNSFEFAKDATWKVTNTKDEWIANKSGVGFDSSKSTAGAFEIDTDGNIKVLTAGTYDITLNIWNFVYDGKDVVAGAQIYAVAHEAPAGPSISFGIANPVVEMDADLEIPVTATNCSGLVYSCLTGDSYVEIDLAESDDTKLIVHGVAEGTATIKALASDGTTQATIDVECVEETPEPPTIQDYVVYVQRNGSTSWEQLTMNKNASKETEYVYSGDFAAGDMFVIHMNGDPTDASTWYHFSDVKSGCANLVENPEESGNIKLKSSGNYTIYSDSVNDSGHIWISMNAFMKIEGGASIKMDTNPDKNGEFMLKDVELTTTDIFFFEYGGKTYGFENLKSDCPSVVECAAGAAKHLVAKADGSYDIYFDPTVLDNKTLYIAEHVEYEAITLTLVPGVWALGIEDYYAYFFGGTTTPTWVKLTNNGSGFTVEVPEGYTKVIFVRYNAEKSPLTEANPWDSAAAWNQTSDLDIPADGKVKFTISGWEKSDNTNSNWSSL